MFILEILDFFLADTGPISDIEIESGQPCLRHTQKKILIFHFLHPVWFDSNPRGSLHGSPEHRPAAAAERRLA